MLKRKKKKRFVLSKDSRKRELKFAFVQIFEMSCQRGNNSRTRKQKYQNATTFKNDLYDKSKTIQQINAIEHKGICEHCKNILEWRVHFRKYKPLTQPRKWFETKNRRKREEQKKCFRFQRSLLAEKHSSSLQHYLRRLRRKGKYLLQMRPTTRRADRVKRKEKSIENLLSFCFQPTGSSSRTRTRTG